MTNTQHKPTTPQEIRKAAIAGAHLSDDQVANRVRMLMRGDIDHEVVCVMARDRIMHLAEQNVAMLDALRECVDQLESLLDDYEDSERPAIAAKAGRAILAKFGGAK